MAPSKHEWERVLARLSLRQSETRLLVLEFVFLVDAAARPVPMARGFAAAERSRHERLARRIGIALRGARGDFLTGHRRRLADHALAGAAHQVDVDMIVVINVGA